MRLDAGWEFVQCDLPSVADALGTADASNLSSAPQWKKISMPHCFNAFDAVDPYIPYYKGAGWYRTSVRVSNPFAGGRTLLQFEGAGQRTQVYVGRELVASHAGGYDCWTADITAAAARALQDGELQALFKGRVPLSIRCDNAHCEELVPSDLSDFNLYGGLYRAVNLLYRPAVSVEQLHVTPQLSANGKTGSVRIDIACNAPCPEGTGKRVLRIADPRGREVLNREIVLSSDGRESSFHFTLKGRPMLWDVDCPQLYSLTLSPAAGSGENVVETETFGFRQTEFKEHGPFFLNGRRLLLRGTHRHEDHAGVGAAMTDRQITDELLQIKAMGANFIRLGHYQQSDLVLHLCDSLGLLVWEESPWCRNYVTTDTMRHLALGMLASMINRHYNHPSVLLWGMGNEVDWLQGKPYYDKERVAAFLREMTDLSHRLDPTRLTSLRRCDFASGIPDVYSPSIWAGWYGGRFGQYRSMSEKAQQKYSRFLHVEWGGDSHAGRHSEDPFTLLGKRSAAQAGDWSETYMVKLFDWTLKEQEAMPDLTGSAFWTFKDFSTPLRPENPIPYVNQKGVVQRDGTPKESYYVFQSYWAPKPMVHIYGHTWPVRWGAEGEEKEVLVYSNCSEVELFVNGVSQGVKKRRTGDFPASGLHWNCRLEEGKNTLAAVARNGRLVLTDTVETVYQTQKWGKPAAMRLTLARTQGDTCTAEVRFYDANGVFCPDAKNFVEFGLTGNGRLIDNLGTAEGSRRVGASNGRARIHFLAKGAVAVSVSSKKMPTVVEVLK